MRKRWSKAEIHTTMKMKEYKSQERRGLEVEVGKNRKWKRSKKIGDGSIFLSMSICT